MIDLKDVILQSFDTRVRVDDYILHVLKTKKNIIVNFDDNYLLRWSTYKGYNEIVKELLKFDEVNTCDSNYHAFELAIETSNIEIFKLLFNDYRSKKYTDNIFNISVNKCFDYNNIEILKYLLCNYDNIEKYDNHIFHDITYFTGIEFSKRLNFINLLLNDNRFDPTYGNNHPLCFAIINNNYDYIKLLISNSKVKSKINNLSYRYIEKLHNLKLIPNYKHRKIQRTF